MFTKLPFAFALLLSASILTAAHSHELRTGVPYYMEPYFWPIGGGVAPARIGDEQCPSAVTLTLEVDRGVPITFSTSPYDSGESVVIDENTDVYISFNASVCEERKTWGYRFLSPLPSEVDLRLASLAKIYVRARFRIKRENWYYRVYSPQIVDSEGNVRIYYPVSSRYSGRRLVLSSEASFPIFYVFEEAKDDHGMRRSVV